jgi:hypothetical protein
MGDGQSEESLDDDGQALVQEVLHDFPPEERGERPEWEDRVGWHRKEDTHKKIRGDQMQRDKARTRGYKEKTGPATGGGGGGGLRNRKNPGQFSAGEDRHQQEGFEYQRVRGEGYDKGHTSTSNLENGITDKMMLNSEGGSRKKGVERHQVRKSFREGENVREGEKLTAPTRSILWKLRRGRYNTRVTVLGIIILACIAHVYIKPGRNKRSKKQTQ